MNGSPAAFGTVQTPATHQRPQVTVFGYFATGKGKTKKIAKKLSIALTATSAKSISPAGKVRVTLVGPTKRTVTASVNAAGKVTVVLRNVKRGKYSAKLAYAGNTNVSGSKGRVKFKV